MTIFSRYSNRKMALFQFSLALCLLLVTGCSKGLEGETILGRAESPAWFNSASRAKIIVHFTEYCRGYGYDFGTNEFRDCVRETEDNSRSAARARINVWQQSLHKNRSVNCTTTAVGGSGAAHPINVSYLRKDMNELVTIWFA